MDIKIINDQGEQVKEEQPREAGEPNAPINSSNLLKEAIFEVLDLDSREKNRHAAAINTLLEYAISQSEEKTPENIKWAIRQLYLKVGTPPLGENIITYLSRYAYLAMEKNKITKELEKYEQFKQS